MRLRRLLPLLAYLLIGAGFFLINQHYPQLVGNVESLEPGYYRIVSVVDGDTITVQMNGENETVRLVGVDTPETHHPKKPVQCFGHAATDFTTQLIDDQPVRLESDPLSSNRDRYDRLLRYAYLPDGRLVNLEIVAAGYGHAYTSFEFSQAEAFVAAEQAARGANRGLWGACPVSEG